LFIVELAFFLLIILLLVIFGIGLLGFNCADAAIDTNYRDAFNKCNKQEKSNEAIYPLMQTLPRKYGFTLLHVKTYEV
jgi:hypothetical protein